VDQPDRARPLHGRPDVRRIGAVSRVLVYVERLIIKVHA
jgi:hypothetical protein